MVLKLFMNKIPLQLTKEREPGKENREKKNWKKEEEESIIVLYAPKKALSKRRFHHGKWKLNHMNR